MSSAFAIIGSGSLGAFLIEEFLTYKASGSVTTLKIISRSVSLFPFYCPADGILTFRWTGNRQVYQP